jgi:Trk-type K+ transport system membrane component
LKYLIYRLKALYQRLRVPILTVSTWVAFLCSVIVVLVAGYSVGFKIPPGTKEFIFSQLRVILQIICIVSVLRIIFGNKALRKEGNMQWFSLILLLLTFVIIYNPSSHSSFGGIPFNYSYWIVLCVLVLFSLLEIARDIVSILSKNANPVMVFVLSFLSLITVGTLLLLFPNSTVSGISVVDALFTSTSAVCVTGLTSVPFHSTFTIEGQIIVLCLIQAGGLGVITITSFFALFFLEGLSVNSQYMIKDIISGSKESGLIPLVSRIVTVTFLMELSGAVCIYFTAGPYLAMDLPQRVFFSVFHSVSAFCNAGFSTLPHNLAEPALLNCGPFYLIISLLIVLGGIGFPILTNIIKIIKHRFYQFSRLIKGRPFRRYVREWDMNSVIVLKTTGMLLLLGTLYFIVFESDNMLAPFTGADKVIQAFFHSVVPRTAGFNSVDVSSLAPPTFMILLILMWIGASPQSTGGGIKVTTFALMISNLFQLVKGKNKVEIAGREISSLSVTRAFATVSISLIIIILSYMAITYIEPGIAPGKILFEIISAIGTVGLSMGITPDLQESSKLIVILLMFIGRVGVVTFFTSFVRRRIERRYSYPKADIMIN